LERVALLHLQPVALRLLTALVFYMQGEALLEVVVEAAARLELAAETVAEVVLHLMAVRLAVLAAIPEMVAAALEIMVAQRLVRQVLAEEAAAAVVPGLILRKPVAVG
jgi:hypothetical protein